MSANELSNSDPNKLTELKKVEDNASTGQNQENVEFDDAGEPSEEDRRKQELDMLRTRCSVLGIPFSNNTKDPAVLLAKIKEHNEKLEADAAAASNSQTNTTSGEGQSAQNNDTDVEQEEPVKPTKNIRQFLKEREMRLIRVRISCLDPKKKDLEGEIFTIANQYIGTVKKFVPFGERTDNGYHVPYCILKFMAKRKFTSISSKTVNGRIVVTTRDVREFSIDELPPLTPEELAKLSAQQAAAAGLDN